MRVRKSSLYGFPTFLTRKQLKRAIRAGLNVVACKVELSLRCKLSDYWEDLW